MRRWWLLWALGLAVWAQVQAQAPVAASAGPVLRLTQAEFALGEGAEPPQAGWQPARLPEFFLSGQHPPERIGWYRLAFDLPAAPPGPRVLLAQRVVTTAEFRLNGVLLNADVRFGVLDGALGTQMTNRPQWMVVPAALFCPGRNELLVRLAGDAITAPWISGIAIGSAAELRGEYLLRDIVQHELPRLMAAMLMVALPMGLWLWWRERHLLQGLLALTLLFWLAAVLLYLSPEAGPPVSRRGFAVLTVVLWVAFHWALLGLLWRLAGRPWRWFGPANDVASALPLVAAIGVLVLEPHQRWLGLLMLPATLLRVAASVMMAGWALRERSPRALALTAAEWLWFAGMAQATLVALDVLPPDPFMLSPAGALPLFVVLLVLGVQHQARQRALAAAAREAAVQEERRRMMLEMHDGVGAQLATAVRLARHDEVPREAVAQAVEEALQELRLVIDALDPDVGQLPPLLGLLRERVEPRLRALGHPLEWHVDALPPQPPLSASAALDILRIAQEALNNALRHAGATRLSVGLHALEGGCELRIADDGIGFDGAVSGGAGRGLTSMRRRAERLGGRLAVRPGNPRGTVVTLWLPAR